MLWKLSFSFASFKQNVWINKINSKWISSNIQENREEKYECRIELTWGDFAFLVFRIRNTILSCVFNFQEWIMILRLEKLNIENVNKSSSWPYDEKALAVF